MNATTVSKIIDDLATNPGFFNAHGIDLESCRVPPRKIRFKDSFRDGEFLYLWLVLRELSDDEDGYLVVFG